MGALRAVVAVCLLGLTGAGLVRAQAAEPVPVQPEEPAEALSELGDAVGRLAAEARSRGFAALQRKEYPAALAALRQAQELDPRDVTVLDRLAFLHGLLGERGEAERLLRRALEVDPERLSTVLALTELLLLPPVAAEGLGEVATLAAKARQLGGNRPEIVTLQARAAAASGQLDEAERFYRQAVALAPANATLALAFGDFLRERGRDELALEQYRRVAAGDPQFELAARRSFELEVEREARHFGLQRADERVPERAVQLYERARQQAAAGQLAEAERAAREALRVAPGYGLARVELARLQEGRGDRPGAEQSYLLALALDSGRLEAYAGLVELYLATPTDGRAAQAALLAERALSQQPDRAELHLLAARAHRAAGDLVRALGHVDRYLARDGAGTDQPEALALQRELGALVGAQSAALQPAVGVGAGSTAKALQRARAHLTRGETDAALAVLARIEGGALLPEVLNLQAAILSAAGRPEEARQALVRSLEVAPGQPELRLRLGRVLAGLRRAAEARVELVRAERQGSAEARLELAQLDAAERPGVTGVVADARNVVALWQAQERLSELLAASSEPRLRAAARPLHEAVQIRLWRVFGLGVAALLALLAAVWSARQRRYGGLSLAELLEQKPELGPELQRVLSAIRHEVLKHNALLLRGLVTALRSGEPLGDRGRHAERALCGDASSPGAATRLKGYAEQLRQLGRSHGVRLNLEQRDAALSALLGGFDELLATRAALRECEQASPVARRRLAARLERALDRILDEGAGQLDALLDEVRLLHVDAARLRAVFEAVRREPGLAMQPIGALELDAAAELPVALELPAAAFDDVLANLIRNALQASLQDAALRPVAVGVHVQRRLDPVTGHERAAFLVRDRSSQPLDAQALQGGYIERGLGLTADLAARHDGTLELITGEPGWSKAVALVVPCAEAALEAT
jgi:Tfp pilus assembly protein PilF